MWKEPPLWEKVWLGRWSKVYLNAGKVIGYLGCSKATFEEVVSKLPEFDKYHYETAVRELTVFSKREQEGRYELTPTAKKVLRPIIGPAPDDPCYATWWRARLVSFEQMKRDGQPVEWAEAPPVPLPGDKLAEAPKEAKPAKAKKPAARRAKKSA